MRVKLTHCNISISLYWCEGLEEAAGSKSLQPNVHMAIMVTKKQPRVPLPREFTQCPATDGNRCRCGEMGTTSRNPTQASPPFLTAAGRFPQSLSIQVCSILFTYWKACEFAIGLKSLLQCGRMKQVELITGSVLGHTLLDAESFLTGCIFKLLRECYRTTKV